MSKEIELCNIEIESYSERTSQLGKALKNAFAIGPSVASSKYGKITDKNTTTTKDTTTNNDKEDNTTDKEDNKDSGVKNDSYERVYSYSILEACTNMKLMYNERSSDDSMYSDYYTDDDMSDIFNKVRKYSDTQREHDNDIDKITDSSEDTNSDDSKEKEESPFKETFEPGESYTFKLEMPNEGFSEWTVLFDKRVDTGNIKNMIRSKKFKTAMLEAGKGLQSDGLIPMKIRTCIYDVDDVNKTPMPKFMGHCRYALDSGSTDDAAEDNLTLCLAVAPIDAVTNEPNQYTVIQAIYNVTGDITGGKLGNIIASVDKKVRDYADGNNNRYGYSYYNSDSDNTDKTKSKELSDYLHKAFRCVGDSSMYPNYLNLTKYIKKQLANKNLEFLTYKVGNYTVNKLDDALRNSQIVYF